MEAVWAEIEETAPDNGGSTFDGDDSWLSVLTSGLASGYGRRMPFVWRFAWAIPSREAISRIAAFVGDRRVLEVGAGRGLWAALLRDQGVNVHATDVMPGGRSPTENLSEREHMAPEFTYCDVEKIGAVEAVQRYSFEALMLCWPALSDPFAVEALRAFSGDTVVYVGEGEGGCTADDAFHDLLEAEWDKREQVTIPQWPGIHDHVFLYRRR